MFSFHTDLQSQLLIGMFYTRKQTDLFFFLSFSVAVSVGSAKVLVSEIARTMQK